MYSCSKYFGPQDNGSFLSRVKNLAENAASEMYSATMLQALAPGGGRLCAGQSTSSRQAAPFAGSAHRSMGLSMGRCALS
ncbi:hypothetical protein AK812_SmicGene45936, partial [Symbiodinium microadriaticum]